MIFDNETKEIAIRIYRIRCLIDYQASEKAKKLCFEAIQLFPNEPEFYSLLGVIWQWVEKRYIDGEIAHLKSVSLAPQHSSYNLNKLCLLNIVRFPDDDVETVIHYCLTLHNIDKARVLGEWALWLEYNGHFQEAIEKNKERYLLLQYNSDLDRVEGNIERIKEKIRISSKIINQFS